VLLSLNFQDLVILAHSVR